MKGGKLIKENLTREVIGAFYEVYSTLGFGFLEHLYVKALERELTTLGHEVQTEVPVAVIYKGLTLGIQRVDMIIDGQVVIETKSSFELPKTGTRQLLNYLRATDLEVGLLLHFGPEPKFYRVVSTNPRPSA